MILDINDDIVRERFSNVQITVMGEESLVQRILPIVTIQERRLIRDFIYPSMMSDEILNPICIDVVVYAALWEALPMLDVVMTPNGLATVGNNTLSPASAARSKAARDALASLLFQSQEALINELRNRPDWCVSFVGNKYSRSLFVSLTELCRLRPDRSGDSFDLAMIMQMMAVRAENSFADHYISNELMASLRRKNLMRTLSVEEAWVVDRIKEAVAMTVSSNGFKSQMLIDVVNYIRERPAVFPEWQLSKVARTFDDHAFKNKKNSKAFFF